MGLDRALLKKGVISGIRKGWEGYIWILKILLPISLFTTLLEWSGVLHHLDPLLRPVMGFLSLPAVAALPILMAIFTGIYAGIAAMSALPLTLDQMTLIAIFMMICHGLIQEGIIQGKSGLHFAKATLFRVGAAIITVLAVAPFLQSSTDLMGVAATGGDSLPPLFPRLHTWAISTFYLLVKIFVITMSLLTLLEMLKVLGWIHPIARVLAPVLKLLGLSQRVAFLWVAGAVFGLSYSAVVIMEEVKEGTLTKEELEDLHLSIGIHHSFIEDPIIFMALGLQPFWMWIPRLVAAIVTVRLFSLWQRYAKKGARSKAYGQS
jgi:hypothetical protein